MVNRTFTVEELVKGVTLRTGKVHTASVKRTDVSVTAQVDSEFLIVPISHKLDIHQPAGETKRAASPIRLELKLSQDPKVPAVKASLSTNGIGRLSFFADEAMTKPLATAALSALTLTSGNLKLWMLGTTPGKVEISVQGGTTAGVRYTKNDPEKLKILVAQLEAQIGQQDALELAKLKCNPDVAPIATYHNNLKALVFPDQKVLTPEERIKTGRILHEQKSKAHGRAKLTLPKLDSALLPAGAESHQLVLKTATDSGALQVFDKEFEGVKQSLPLKIPVSNLTGQDKILWVEGEKITDKPRDARLELSLDRPGGGLSHKPKGNVDWCTFTVVSLDTVDVEHTAQAGAPAAWDSTTHRFYINLQADDAGRKLHLTAKISKPIADVVVHFCLVPHEDNQKRANWGEDLPATWQWETIDSAFKRQDKAAWDDLIHVSAKTDAQGLAKAEVTLSRFGGDKFLPAAYIDQDSHLAKYVHNHADLGKKKPSVAAFEINVWRRFWYQMTRPQGFAAPQPGAAETCYEEVKSDMVLGNSVTYTAASAPRTFYPRYVIDGGNDATQVSVVGSHNKTQLGSLFVAGANQPVKSHVIVCEYQYDEDSGGPAAGSTTLAAPPPGGSVKLAMNKAVFDPPLQGGTMATSVRWSQGAASGVIANAAVSVPQPRADNQEVEITLPAGLPVASVAAPLRLTVQCQAADGPYLGESFQHHTLVVYDANDVPDYNDTVAHEIGHGFDQTPQSGAQPNTIPDHPNWFAGMGIHCNFGNKKCVMYESGPQATGIHKYCKICHPYLLLQDMSSF